MPFPREMTNLLQSVSFAEETEVTSSPDTGRIFRHSFPSLSEPGMNLPEALASSSKLAQSPENLPAIHSSKSCRTTSFQKDKSEEDFEELR